MSAKEFGQYRASQAKNKLEKSEANLADDEAILNRDRNSIAEARKRLEEMRKNGESTEVISKKEESLLHVERELDILEMSIKNGREKLMEKGVQLKKVSELQMKM
jgi:hypothetical protein